MTLHDDLADGLARRIGLLRERGALLVADVRQKRRHDADAAVEPRLAAGLVGLEIDEQLVDEGVDAVREAVQRAEEIVRDHRLHDVKLELAVLHAERHREIMRDRLIARLIEHLGDHGIDLARHDGGTGLPLRQLEFRQAAARAARHEAEVVRHLDEHERRRLERARHLGEDIRIVRRVDEVLRRHIALPRDLRELLAHERDIRGLRVESRTDGRAAHVDDMEALLCLLDAPHAAPHGGRIGAHLLTERDGHGVLQMRAPHLEDVLVGLRLPLELRCEAVERRAQPRRFAAQADLDGRGEYIVRRLRHVRVVVRRDDVIAAARLAEQLERAVREHLVHVHIDRRARAALDRVERELVEELAREDLVRRAHERLADAGRETPRLHVRERRRLFHCGHRLHEIAVDRLPRDLEILLGAQRLHTVVSIVRHLELPEEIMFLPHDSHPFLSIIIIYHLIISFHLYCIMYTKYMQAFSAAAAIFYLSSAHSAPQSYPQTALPLRPHKMQKIQAFSPSDATDFPLKRQKGCA